MVSTLTLHVRGTVRGLASSPDQAYFLVFRDKTLLSWRTFPIRNKNTVGIPENLMLEDNPERERDILSMGNSKYLYM